MEEKALSRVVVFVGPEISDGDLNGFPVGGIDIPAAEPTLHLEGHDTNPNSLPTATNASTARSMSPCECAADICVLIRA